MSNNQQNARGWQEVGGGGDVDFLWKPHNNATGANNPLHPEMVTGYLKELKELNGPRGPYLFAILYNPANGATPENTIGMACGKVLGDKLEKVTIGRYIAVKYLGKSPSKQGGSYNNYSVQEALATPLWNFGAMKADFGSAPVQLPPVSQAPSNPAPQAQAPVQPQMPPQKQFVPPVNTQEVPPGSVNPMTQRTPSTAPVQPSFPAQGWPASDGNDDLPF